MDRKRELRSSVPGNRLCVHRGENIAVNIEIHQVNTVIHQVNKVIHQVNKVKWLNCRFIELAGFSTIVLFKPCVCVCVCHCVCVCGVCVFVSKASALFTRYTIMMN